MVFHAIGLMSGTSLDGLDICFARFEKQDEWTFKILKAETLSYSKNWEDTLLRELKSEASRSAIRLILTYSIDNPRRRTKR